MDEMFNSIFFHRCFFRIGHGDLVPSDDSDEDGWDESCTVRNPKGKLKFLYGPWDPKARRRYINSGKATFPHLVLKMDILIFFAISRPSALHWREC